jgi:hypothetical protein
MSVVFLRLLAIYDFAVQISTNDFLILFQSLGLLELKVSLPGKQKFCLKKNFGDLHFWEDGVNVPFPILFAKLSITKNHGQCIQNKHDMVMKGGKKMTY